MSASPRPPVVVAADSCPGPAPSAVPAGSSERRVPAPTPCLCPGANNWGPALMVKVGRSVSQVLAIEVCFEPNQLGGALQRLYESSGLCNLFGLWVTPGYFPGELAERLNEWWPTLDGDYWDVLCWRHQPRVMQEYEVATVPLTNHYPGYLDRQTQQFRAYCMARFLTIVNFSGAALVIDLHPYKDLPAGLAQFLDNPRILKAAFQWPQDSQALTRRFATVPAGQSIIDLFQMPGGWTASAPSPLTTLRAVAEALMGSTELIHQFYQRIHYYNPTQFLGPLFQQIKWDLLSDCTCRLALWLIDLVVINYSPAEVRLDGVADPVMAALHNMLLQHYVQNQTRYLPTATDADTLCNLYRGPRLSVSVQHAIYYDTYRLLLKAYLNAGADNQFVMLFAPLEPDPSEDYRYPNVPTIVPDSYPWQLFLPDANRSATDLRVLVRTAVADRQRYLGRVDVTWVQEAVPGCRNPQLQVTPEEVARFVAWTRIADNELRRYLDRLKREQNDMRNVNRVMQHLRKQKMWLPDAPTPPESSFTSTEAEPEAEVSIEVPPGSPPRAESRDDSLSSISVRAGVDPGQTSTLARSGQSVPGFVSPAATPSPSEQFPSISSNVPLPGKGLATPYYESLKAQWQRESAEQAGRRPPVSRPRRPEVPVQRSAARQWTKQARQPSPAELRWGCAPAISPDVNPLGRSRRHPRFPSHVATQECARLTILECTRQFFKSYTYQSYTEPTLEESTRRDFLLAVLYAQFPAIEVFPPLYAFRYPFTAYNLLRREKLEMPALVPAEAWVSHWWDDQNRLLSLCNPDAHIPEPADILYDLSYQVRSPEETFRVVLQTAQLYYSAHHGKVFRRHPESAVPLFRPPVMGPAISPVPRPSQDVPSSSTAPDPDAFGPPMGSDLPASEETTPKTLFVPEAESSPVVSPNYQPGRDLIKASSLPTLPTPSSQSSRENQGDLLPSVPPTSATVRSGEVVEEPADTLLDKQIALRQRLAADVERRDQEAIDFRKRLLKAGVTAAQTQPTRSADAFAALLGNLPASFAATPETTTTQRMTMIDLGGGSFREFSHTEMQRVYRLGNHELRREYLDIRQHSDTYVPAELRSVTMATAPPPILATPEAPLVLGGGFHIDWSSLATDMTLVTIRSPDMQTPRPSSPS